MSYELKKKWEKKNNNSLTYPLHGPEKYKSWILNPKWRKSYSYRKRKHCFSLVIGLLHIKLKVSVFPCSYIRNSYITRGQIVSAHVIHWSVIYITCNMLRHYICTWKHCYALISTYYNWGIYTSTYVFIIACQMFWVYLFFFLFLNFVTVLFNYSLTPSLMFTHSNETECFHSIFKKN